MNCKDGVCLLKKNYDSFFTCKNYEVCYNYSEKYLDGFCLDCNNLFGKWRNNLTGESLRTIQNNSCHICENTLKKISVFRPNCNNNHYLCVDCFRLLYYGYRLEEPVFPYKMETTDKELIEKENENFSELDDDKYNDVLLIRYYKLKKHYVLFKSIHDKLLYNSSCFECKS